MPSTYCVTRDLFTIDKFLVLLASITLVVEFQTLGRFSLKLCQMLFLASSGVFRISVTRRRGDRLWWRGLGRPLPRKKSFFPILGVF